MKFEKDDVVECVDATNTLTRGKRYKVVEYSSLGDSRYVRVEMDNRGPGGFLVERFKRVSLRVGDKVEVVGKSNCQERAKIGEVLTITVIREDRVWCNEYGYYWKLADLRLLEGEMDRYTELKEAIDRVEAWDEKADNILQEVNTEAGHGSKYRFIVEDYNNVGDVYILNHGTFLSAITIGKLPIKIKFSFSSQCGKLSAFKKALTWLLDDSDIKKTLVGKEVKADIEEKVYKVRVIEEV